MLWPEGADHPAALLYMKGTDRETGLVSWKESEESKMLLSYALDGRKRNRDKKGGKNRN
jgi:hypothetical protein